MSFQNKQRLICTRFFFSLFQNVYVGLFKHHLFSTWITQYVDSRPIHRAMKKEREVNRERDRERERVKTKKSNGIQAEKRTAQRPIFDCVRFFIGNQFCLNQTSF